MKSKVKQKKIDIYMALIMVVIAVTAIGFTHYIKENYQETEYIRFGADSNDSARTQAKLLQGDYVCTVSISCEKILDHMDRLRAGKKDYVPEDGWVLEVTEVGFNEGDTAFDVLKKVCELKDIQVEFAYTPLYKSYYIEGIHQLYEFDCGAQSGWMYTVNGGFPNYGSSQFELTDGDLVEWVYTVDGNGQDVGGGVQ